MELVSVIIPSKNSSATISSCLESVKNQTYSNTEIIVVDGYSTDGSSEFCKNQNAMVFKSEFKLLGARYVGLQKSSGKYVVMIDSDQILEKACIQGCVDLIEKGFDMICLEERSLNPKTLVQKMFEADRLLIHEQADLHMIPLYGAINPRFYRRTILEKAFAVIPEVIFPIALAWEDAILYFEASKLSSKVAIVRNAIWHQEPQNLSEVWYKTRKYGKSARQLAKTGHYSSLLSKKIRFRRSRGISKKKIQSDILQLLKAPGYMTGFYLG